MRISTPLALAALALSSLATLAQSPASSPAEVLTPPMGWNSWNYFAEKVDDKGVRAAADQLVATGMKDAGYIYVNIDDTWEGERDATGVLHTNSRFPDMKALADYVHSKGLKIGIYSSPGPKTCANYEGSLGHEEQDDRSMHLGGIEMQLLGETQVRRPLWFDGELEQYENVLRLQHGPRIALGYSIFRIREY